MSVNEPGQQNGVIRLIENIAANDQVKLSQTGILLFPTCAYKRDAASFI